MNKNDDQMRKARQRFVIICGILGILILLAVVCLLIGTIIAASLGN